MLTLHDLQSAFCRSMSGEAPDALLQAIADDGFTAAARLGIYRNNVVTRLTDALSATFPVVVQLVDARFFEYAAGEFLRQQLPASGCLSDFGEYFPAFLAAFGPASPLHYLADVGRLEWAIHESRRAPAVPPVGIAALAALSGDPAQFKLRIRASTKFIASPIPVDQIWSAHQSERAWEHLPLLGDGVRLQIDGADGLRISPLEPSIWELRARLAEGGTLGTAIAAALAISTDFDVAAALADVFADDLVIELTPGEET